MQFDLEPLPPGKTAVSTRWLSACFLSLGQDAFVNGPVTISFKAFLSAFQGRKKLVEEEERQMVLDEMSQVSDRDLQFEDDMQDLARIDEFVSWLMRKLLWMPVFNSDEYAACILFTPLSISLKFEHLLCLNVFFRFRYTGADSASQLGVQTNVPKSLAFSLLQSLALNVSGLSLFSGASGQSANITEQDAPSLQENVEFKAASVVNIDDLRHKSRTIKFSDPELMAMPAPGQDITDFCSFGHLRRAAEARVKAIANQSAGFSFKSPHASQAGGPRLSQQSKELLPHQTQQRGIVCRRDPVVIASHLSQLTEAWTQAACSLRLFFRMQIDSDRVRAHRALFNRLLRQDLSAALGVSVARIRVGHVRPDYADELKFSQVEVEVLPDEADALQSESNLEVLKEEEKRHRVELTNVPLSSRRNPIPSSNRLSMPLSHNVSTSIDSARSRTSNDQSAFKSVSPIAPAQTPLDDPITPSSLSSIELPSSFTANPLSSLLNRNNARSHNLFGKVARDRNAAHTASSASGEFSPRMFDPSELFPVLGNTPDGNGFDHTSPRVELVDQDDFCSVTKPAIVASAASSSSSSSAIDSAKPKALPSWKKKSSNSASSPPSDNPLPPTTSTSSAVPLTFAGKSAPSWKGRESMTSASATPNPDLPRLASNRVSPEISNDQVVINFLSRPVNRKHSIIGSQPQKAPSTQPVPQASFQHQHPEVLIPVEPPAAPTCREVAFQVG
jgi:hypothetical protein